MCSFWLFWFHMVCVDFNGIDLFWPNFIFYFTFILYTCLLCYFLSHWMTEFMVSTICAWDGRWKLIDIWACPSQSSLIWSWYIMFALYWPNQWLELHHHHRTSSCFSFGLMLKSVILSRLTLPFKYTVCWTERNTLVWILMWIHTVRGIIYSAIHTFIFLNKWAAQYS